MIPTMITNFSADAVLPGRCREAVLGCSREVIVLARAYGLAGQRALSTAWILLAW
jgi:hypothetical protein